MPERAAPANQKATRNYARPPWWRGQLARAFRTNKRIATSHTPPHPRGQAARATKRRLLWLVVVGIAVLVLAVQGVRLFHAIQASANTTSDFCDDYLTAQHWFDGAQVYTPVNCWGRYSSTPLPLEYDTHPPPSLLVIAPFALLSYASASWVWGILNLACLIASFLLVCRELNLWRPRIVLPLLALFLLWDPTLQSTRAANIGGGISCLLIALLWLALRRGQQRWAGILGGVVILLKPVPLLLPLCFLLRRQWRAFVSMVLAMGAAMLLSVVVLGPQVWLEYLGPIPTNEGYATGVPGNLAVESYVARWLSGYREYLHPGAVRAFPDLPPLFPGFSVQTSVLLGELLAGLLVVGCSFWLWRREAAPRWDDSDDAAFGFLFILTFLIFPRTWHWNLGMIAMPLLWLGIKLASIKSRGGRALYGAALLILAIPFNWFVPAFRAQARPTLPWPVQAGALLVTTLPSVALVLLLAALWPWLTSKASLMAAHSRSQQEEQEQ
jgi:hypothetical protein